MVIKAAEFVISNTQISLCPEPNKPEFAFIGRSNVGKSSLINTLVGRKNLAKISTRPGKTQTINHFIINDSWYLVDLPGYGFASASQESRFEWSKMIEHYLLERENLYCTFILLDARLKPQDKDLDFIRWLGTKGIPVALVLTKADKLSRNDLTRSVTLYQSTLLNIWEELPPFFISSAETKAGKEEILSFIEAAMKRQGQI
jgi:GTP-binding protein